VSTNGIAAGNAPEQRCIAILLQQIDSPCFKKIDRLSPLARMIFLSKQGTKDYVTSPLPSDTPAICFKNLHDLSTTYRRGNRISNRDFDLARFDGQWQATFCTHLKA
jgi:hypothetical protein